MSLSRRWTHSEQVIPLKPGAVPQYVIKCHGTHRQGLVKDVSTIIASRGASVAVLGARSARKILMSSHTRIKKIFAY